MSYEMESNPNASDGEVRPVSRRQFLHTAGLATAAGASIMAASSAKGQTKKVGANDTIVLGVIGCGSRGNQVMRNFLKQPGLEIGAICDVDTRALASTKAVAGEKAKEYKDLRRLLEQKDIDAVLVATPDQWHVLATIMACEAGKDVYVEKPLGVTIAEGRAAVAAARKYNRIVQIGTQQRNWAHYRAAVDYIHSGALGDISMVHTWDVENQNPGFGAPPDCDPPAELDWDFWLGPSPKVPYNPNRHQHHYWFYDYGGAWQVDWAVHHYEVVHWAMGVTAPLTAVGLGGKFAFANDNRQWPDTFTGACEYPSSPMAKNGFLMTYTFRGGNNLPIEGCYHGKAFYGSRGVLVLNRNGFDVIFSRTQDKKETIDRRTVQALPETETHAKVFLECVRTRTKPEADIEIGHWATNPGHLMNIAYRVGRKVKWDAQKEQIIGDEEASKLLTREFRKPWHL